MGASVRVPAVIVAIALGFVTHGCSQGTPMCGTGTWDPAAQVCVWPPVDASTDADASEAGQPMDVVSMGDGASGSDVAQDAFGIDAGDVATSADANSIVPPRPVAPLSTSTVTTSQPMLLWALSGGDTGASVDLCRDNVFTSTCQSLVSTGNSVFVPSMLQPGVWFWRLHGQVGSTVGMSVGPTWEFIVPARNTPVNSSYSSVLDVNGDGLADLAIGASSSNAVYVYNAQRATPPVPATPSATLTPPVTDGATNFGGSVASAGDVNGDGYADLIVGTQSLTGTAAGIAYVFFGGVNGVASTPSVTLRASSPASFGFAVAGAGDVNGDGYGDILVGAPGTLGTPGGSVFLFLGSPIGPSTTPYLTMAPLGTTNFGWSLSGAADFDGDGHSDVAIGAYESGGVFVFRGGTIVTTTGTPTWTATTTLSGVQYAALGSAGDVNGDGYTDLAVVAGTLSVYAGTPTTGGTYPLITTPIANQISDPDPRAGCMMTQGFTGVALCDANGDGYSDVITSSPGAVCGVASSMCCGTMANVGYVYFGSIVGIPSTPASTVTGLPQQYSGWSVASPGDVNGDGLEDVLLGSSSNNTASLYLGSTGGFQTPAAQTFALPGTGLGSSVAANRLHTRARRRVLGT